MARGLLTLTAVFLAAIPAFGQAKPEDAIKKAIDAHGGAEVLNKYPAGTSAMKGTLIVEGSEIPFTGTLVFAVPGKVHMEIIAETGGQKVTLAQIINGDKVRQIENGRTAELTDVVRDELKQTPTLQELSLLTPLLNAKKYTLEAEKDEDVNGKPAIVVTAKAKGLKDVKLFFDKASGLLLKMQRKALNPGMKEVMEDTLFGDYKTISGMIVPMKSTVTHDGKPFMIVTVTEYKPMEKIDEKEFTISD